MSTPLIPFLETLTKGARAAYPVIQALVAAGQSGQEVYETLQAAGLGARKQDVLAIVRNVQGAILARSDVTKFLANQVPDITRIREAATKIIAPFSYTLEVSLLDPYTGQTETVLRTAHSNQLLSPSEAASTFALDAAPDGVYDDRVINDVRTIDIIKAGAQGII